MDKLVIFDCDGVLIDSEIISNRIDAEIFTSLGYPITPEENMKRFVGLNSKTVRQIIFDETGLKLPENLNQLARQKLDQAFANNIKPLIPNVLEFVRQSNITRCVASSSSKDYILCFLELTQQLHFFHQDHVFTATQVEKGKPAPDLFLFAANQMGYLPEKCLVIEDSVPGITAAQQADMKVIGFLGGEHAKYDWYEQRVRDLDIPIAFTANELLKFIQKNL